MVIEKAKESAKRFNQELRKSINTAVVAAFGLITALAWQEVIKQLVSDIVVFSPVQGLLINALIITIISAIVIMIVTREKSPEPEK